MIGEIINDRYRLDAVLGHGGMGAVYRGHDLQLERDVAIKLLNQVVFIRDERDQLFHEAKLIAKLRHPNIVSVFDVGDFGDTPFFVMEYVDGGSLRDQPGGDFDDRIRITIQICRGLTYAHEQGIIHRDLKPENVLLEKEGRVKLADFGIARSDVTRFTSQGQIAGTAHYLAPEIIKGEAIDNRTDLYSLGVIMYEMNAGKLPFDADTLIGLINQHLFQEVIPPQEINPDIPPNLNELILRLLNKDPGGRPSSGSEVVQALEKISGTNTLDTETIEKIPVPTRITNHNLKAHSSSFVGRQADLKRIHKLLSNADNRLLTLVGSGGIGKTRLATQAAYKVLDMYPDGVWMIELASLTEAGLLPQRVAAVFGVSAQEARQGQGETEVLVDYLRDKLLLLVIDNCEHLIESCAEFVDTLLNGCPNLRVLATSREDLRIPGETIYRVNPLVLPGDNILPEENRNSEAIQLFIERAAAARRDFELSPENSTAIYQICSQLDGLPLAIELAAARIKLLTPEQIAERLEDRFQLLTAGSRTALPRHQTLEAAMDWSYDLLSDTEQVLLRILSVFSGGFSLGDVDGVIEHSETDRVLVFDVIAQLVDKSLVLIDEHEGNRRYKVLETVKQYGIKKLQEAGEYETARQGHLDYFVQLAEQSDLDLRSSHQIESLSLLDAEHDNLRSALRWSLNTENKDMALRLVGALGWYWFMRGYWVESAVWLKLSMELSKAADPMLEARAIIRAGGLELIRGKVEGKIEHVEQALQVCRTYNDLEGTAWCLNLLGQAGTWGYIDSDIAIANLSESINLFSKIDDEWGTAWSTRYLGQVVELTGELDRSIELQKNALDSFEKNGDIWNCAHSLYLVGGSYYKNGNFDDARWAYEQSLENCKLVEDKVMAAHAIRGLAQLAIQLDELDKAEQLSQDALEALQKIGDDNCAAGALRDLGEIYRIRGDFTLAYNMLNESLEKFNLLGNEAPICLVLERFAALAASTGDNNKSVLLLAYVEAHIGDFLLASPTLEDNHQQIVISNRDQLGDELYEQLWREGSNLDLEAAIHLAMD